jgi:hypothetical protein
MCLIEHIKFIGSASQMKTLETLSAVGTAGSASAASLGKRAAASGIYKKTLLLMIGKRLLYIWRA